MHLHALRLRGFKSFPDPVEVRLEPGVAVIVGPNGSGKSNLADAIVWAAGSQSPSELRAEKPDDVLFGGASGSSPADFCEVELVFDSSDGGGPIDVAELSICRRLHRGGEGEYLVNRAPVRRIDLVELLADLGLSGEMHSIIGQGRVEQILVSKPADRRALVEEAAGLGGFKHRRHRAELKLARVQAQVERARDLEQEVRKRLRPLALQASAAARAERLRGEIALRQARLAADALSRLERRTEENEERRSAAAAERRRHARALEALLEQRQRAEDELAQGAEAHERSTAALYRLRTALQRLDLRREHADDEARSLAQQLERLSQLAALPRHAGAFEECASAEAALAAAAEQTRAAIESRGELESRARLARGELTALERSLTEGEGLPPAARALADEGRALALASLDVEQGFDRAVAAALAWRTASVLVEDVADGLTLLERARDQGLGALAVLLPRAEERSGSLAEPVPAAEPLTRFVRPAPGAERLAAWLADVWVVDVEQLPQARRGVVVTREGYGYAPERGELWLAGEVAEAILLGLHVRGRALAEQVEALEREAEQAERVATAASQEERLARERAQRAQAVAARVPRPVDPRQLERLEALAAVAKRVCDLLVAALATAGRLEEPLRARVDAAVLRTGEFGRALRELGEREAGLRRLVMEAGERVAAVGIERARLDAERAELSERVGDDAEAALLQEGERERLEADILRLERRLASLGQVNPLAAEEHAHESERLHDLAAQRDDLERSLRELEELRAQLARTVTERFELTYAAVERHFAEIAGTLFPGGSGRLVRVEAGGEAGVEIELQPAGKRVTRLSLLSGGEKALGAISFLFALFLARPCPFYLLDEVEAALDDANIGRFVELLRRFADRAQFVVVTHQKRTMEAADILYGVTMGDGVSQVVSRRLTGQIGRQAQVA